MTYYCTEPAPMLVVDAETCQEALGNSAWNVNIQNIAFLGKLDFECSSPGTSNGGPGAQPSGAPQRPIITQSVVVENPPSLDQDGNEVGLTISGTDPECCT